MSVQLPEKRLIASFDVDAQKTFTPECPDELPVPSGGQIADALNRQAEYAAYRIGSKEAHCPRAHWVASEKHPAFTKMDAPNMDSYWPAHAVPGTLGFEAIDGLPKPTDYDFFVWKGIELDLHPYGACYHDLHKKLSTGVIEFLRHKGVEWVLVGGLATDFCVAETVDQLIDADFTVVLNLSASRAINTLGAEKVCDRILERGSHVIDSCDELMLA
ncbi:MAG: nicotinamidase [Gammaproteobacteria bacterium CG11_big_fil_rev_8_21_14_0_20_46_22]|nr:MAG: nicotinamidase [Gammaproteobacteria bacterium CG12_big_fil_rev_8_21_14_0_65_46_12]PIR11542.1 MAG: nicotinamidase [Gammaproteobacteria bacterium CG11_big_fil_rev_8_21_14_0_20_46_22]